MKILKCHCGEVEIQVDLKKEIDQLKRCNCSMCKRKGTMVTTINKQDLKIIKGAKKIKTYQFKTNVAKHHFCSECGIHTHNLRRADPNTYGINVGCIDEIKLYFINTSYVYTICIRICSSEIMGMNSTF